MKTKLLKPHAEHLLSFRIDSELLDAAQVRSITDSAARELFGIHGRSREDCSGILFPYFDPITQARTGGRIRLDSPANGQKYLSEQGCRTLFFAPVAPIELSDVTIPVILVEAEKSALAIKSCFDRNKQRGVFIAIGGADGWLRNGGKELKSDGHSERVSAPSPSFDLLAWADRKAVIFTDSNVNGRGDLEWARQRLAKELRSRGAEVYTAATPKLDGVNGPDDFLAVGTDAALFDLLNKATAETGKPRLGNEGTSNGLRFAEQHEDKARYWPERKKWII